MDRSSVAITFTVLLLVGCDPTVDTFHENEFDYSIFGYLDASADTQFVRVEQLRDSMLYRAPATLDAEVTLTNLGTGHAVALRDSLFQFSEGSVAHNFYTTRDIQPTATYRLVVQGPGDAESRAQTTIPDSFPSPSVLIPASEPTCDRYGSNLAIVEVEGIDRLVAAKALYYTMPAGLWQFNYLPVVERSPDGTYLVRVHANTDACGIPGAEESIRKVVRLEVMVAAGDPEWPSFTGLDLETETLPTVASNVEGGVGLLGGIVTDTIVVYPPPEEDE